MFCRSLVSVFLFVYQLKHLRLRGIMYMRFINDGQRCNDIEINYPNQPNLNSHKTIPAVCILLGMIKAQQASLLGSLHYRLTKKQRTSSSAI